jgi:Secretion system C-terminal sorting domain
MKKKYFIINQFVYIILMLCVPTLAMAQTHVQTITRFQNTSATSISQAFSASSTSGNLIVVHLSWGGQTVNTTSVIDNKGNIYTKIQGPTNWHGTNFRSELWYAYNITGGGAAINITVNLSAAPNSTALNYSQIYMSEYSGIVSVSNPLDQKAVAIGNTAAVSSGSRTTVYTNELVYGASIGASGTLTVGSGFTSRSTANSNIIEDRNVPAMGSYSTAFTSAGGNWVAEMATFRSTTSVLPITLTYFDTKVLHSEAVEVTWGTASETNNKFFVVERSSNGELFEPITSIEPDKTPQYPKKYTFVDTKPLSGVSYYRIKQTDFDSTTYYSKINSVWLNNDDLVVYPNPTERFFTIENESATLEDIILYDILGRKVDFNIYQHTPTSITLDILNLPSGIYFLWINNRQTSVVKTTLY